VNNEYAPFHIFAAIAQLHGLGFALMPSQTPAVLADSWNKAADFAMENDVICESSLFLFGSTYMQHQVKAISLHLGRDFHLLESDTNAKAEFMTDLKEKLARVQRSNLLRLWCYLFGAVALRQGVPLGQIQRR
jgi:hypothetical protein